MPFRVIVLPRTQRDIENAVFWLAKQSVPAAERWRVGLLEIFEKLETAPNRFPLADESTDLNVEIRELLFGRRRGVYRILFSIDGQAGTSCVCDIRPKIGLRAKSWLESKRRRVVTR